MSTHKSARITKVDKFNDEQADVAMREGLSHVRQLHPTKGYRYISFARFFGPRRAAQRVTPPQNPHTPK